MYISIFSRYIKSKYVFIVTLTVVMVETTYEVSHSSVVISTSFSVMTLTGISVCKKTYLKLNCHCLITLTCVFVTFGIDSSVSNANLVVGKAFVECAIVPLMSLDFLLENEQRAWFAFLFQMQICLSWRRIHTLLTIYSIWFRQTILIPTIVYQSIFTQKRRKCNVLCNLVYVHVSVGRTYNKYWTK